MPWPLFITLSLLLTPAAALAQSCVEAVDQLSARYALASRPPAAEEQAPSLSDKLKDTGGVVKPPEVGAPAAIQPPESGSQMPTAPSLSDRQNDVGGPAAKVAQMESLLAAARAAGERGRAGECLARLAEAEQLAAAADSSASSNSQ